MQGVCVVPGSPLQEEPALLSVLGRVPTPPPQAYGAPPAGALLLGLGMGGLWIHASVDSILTRTAKAACQKQIALVIIMYISFVILEKFNCPWKRK